MRDSSRALVLLFAAVVGESACRADSRPVRAARGAAENQKLLLTELRALPIRADPRDRAAIVTDAGTPMGARRYDVQRLRTWGPALALSR